MSNYAINIDRSMDNTEVEILQEREGKHVNDLRTNFVFDVDVIYVDDSGRETYTIPQDNGGEVIIDSMSVRYYSDEGPMVTIELEAENMEVLENFVATFDNKVTEIQPT